jgi:hypothetical protein
MISSIISTPGRDGVSRQEGLIVAKARLDGRGACGRRNAGLRHRHRAQMLRENALHIAPPGLGAGGVRAVEPDADLGRAPRQQVAPEAGREHQRHRHLAARHTPVEIGEICQRRLLGEVARAGEGGLSHPALARAVLVEHGVTQVLHVEGDAEAHGQHQHDRAEQREAEPDRVAADFHRLAPREGPQARGGEPRGRRGCKRCLRRRRWRVLVGGDARPRVDQMRDERLLQRRRPARFAQRLGRALGQYMTLMHQRNAVAAPGLVHEVSGDEDRHPVAPRQLDQQRPEPVPRHRVHAGGRFVEDQDFGRVQDGDRELQALAHAQGQGLRRGPGHVPQVESLEQRLDPRAALRARQLEQISVQLEVLPHGQFAIEREPLRHVADPPPRREAVRPDRRAEQSGLARARLQQAGQHLHGRGLAATVRADEAEDLAALYAKAHIVHGGEVAKAHRQPLRLYGGWAARGDARRDGDRRMPTPRGLGQHRDKSLLEGRGCALKRGGRPFGQHDARVHGDQPVEVLSLRHRGGGGEHAHARATGADARDQLPELAAR